MSDEKALTKEIAEQFLAEEDYDGDELSKFTAIEDAAAEALSKHRRGTCNKLLPTATSFQH